MLAEEGDSVPTLGCNQGGKILKGRGGVGKWDEGKIRSLRRSSESGDGHEEIIGLSMKGL